MAGLEASGVSLHLPEGCTSAISNISTPAAQVLRVIGKEEPDSVRAEPPHAIRRAQKALPPAMDAAGLAKHLSVAELQVGQHTLFHSYSNLCLLRRQATRLGRLGLCMPMSNSTALHPLGCLLIIIVSKTK